MNSKYALVLALVLGVVAAFAVQQHIRKAEQKARDAIRPVSVIFAAADIPEGTQLRADLLEAKPWPGDLVTSQLISWDEVEKQVGKVASQQIPRGDPVFRSFVEVKPVERSPSGLPAGQRAFTISTDAVSAVAGMVQPGAYVDILAHVKPESGGGGRRGQASAPDAATVTLLSNVQVLSVGQSGGRHWGRGGRETADVSSVTLAVRPLEALLLAHAQKNGSLTLALRKEGDRVPTEAPTVDARNLMQMIARAAEERKGGR